jgi:hypothetical protein
MKKIILPLFMTAAFLFSLPCEAAGDLRVKVTVLQASNNGQDFNFENDAYRDQLVRLFSYSSYQQLDSKLMQLPKTQRVKMDLSDGYELLLTYQGDEGSRAMVQALIRKGNVQYVFTVLAIQNPGVVFLGGPSAGPGVLVIVLETGF